MREVASIDNYGLIEMIELQAVDREADRYLARAVPLGLPAPASVWVSAQTGSAVLVPDAEA